MIREHIKPALITAIKFAWWAGLSYCGAGAAGPKAAVAAVALKEGLDALDNEADKSGANSGP